MRNLSAEERYWLSLLGIIICCLVIGYLIGFARAWKISYDEGYEDGADALREALGKVDRMSRDELPQQILHFTDLKTPPTWVREDIVVRAPRGLNSSPVTVLPSLADKGGLS